MIKPTVGRVVHYYPLQHELTLGPYGVPLAALVVSVHNDNLVSLCVFGTSGDPSPHASVPLVQPDVDENPYLPPNRHRAGYCCWMPYQVKKDTGSESGEQEAGTETI
jgi:hypothetical protein